MNIEEILNRLERIDHKEYSGGFEFADSSTFDEMARCFEERKILAKEIERLNNRVSELEKGVSRKEEQITYLDDENFDLENEIERLNNIIDESEKWLKEEIERLMTIEQSNNIIFLIGAYTEVLDKIKELKGVDKE